MKEKAEDEFFDQLSTELELQGFDKIKFEMSDWVNMKNSRVLNSNWEQMEIRVYFTRLSDKKVCRIVGFAYTGGFKKFTSIPCSLKFGGCQLIPPFEHHYDDSYYTFAPTPFAEITQPRCY